MKIRSFLAVLGAIVLFGSSAPSVKAQDACISGYTVRTTPNHYEKSGFITEYKITNTCGETVRFRITINYAEGGSGSWKWIFSPGQSYTFDLDTRYVTGAVVSRY